MANWSTPGAPTFDTPWDDFPLGRLQPGARLRLTSADGQRVETRLAVLGDSTLDLRSAGGAPLPPLTFAELRAFRRVDVRAVPAWRDRAGNIGFVAGGVIGALTGVALHNGRSSSAGGGDQPSLSEDVAACASVGFFVGWLTGRTVIGRARWRLVTLP